MKMKIKKHLYQIKVFLKMKIMKIKMMNLEDKYRKKRKKKLNLNLFNIKIILLNKNTGNFIKYTDKPLKVNLKIEII